MERHPDKERKKKIRKLRSNITTTVKKKKIRGNQSVDSKGGSISLKPPNAGFRSIIYE